MLIDDLPAFIEGTVPGYDGAICHYHLTMNKDDNQRWSAGYVHYDTGRIMLAINDADTLEEVAVRIDGRLDRYTRMHPPKPRLLQNQQKQDTVVITNVTEGTIMSQPADDKASNDQAASDAQALPGQHPVVTHGQVLVGVDFNPSANAHVDKIKNLAAQMIDEIEALHNKQYPPVEGKYAGAYDVNLLQGHALRHVIDASSACVKRATWPAPSATPADTSNGAGGAK